MITTNIFHDYSETQFEAHAIELFEYQYNNNYIYNIYCKKLNIRQEKIHSIEQIPFLPISFFKTQKVVSGDFTPEIKFYSSGTTHSEPSTHYIKDIKLYEESFIKCFNYFYGELSQYTIIALLPSYFENKSSSLLYMVNKLIKLSGNKDSGFYHHNNSLLYKKLQDLQSKKKKTIVFGVSFALLDFVEAYSVNFPELIVFETGGMKGRRKELVKKELHDILKKGFGVSNIHSEYGMCELLSQAYSCGDNIFSTPPWMKLLLRDEKDPFMVSSNIDSGVINVIDFANVHSCSFIATDDLGKANNGKIEILGRLDQAEIRGCNLLIL